MNIGKFSVQNPVLINILMVTILILGVFSVSRLPREQFREVPFYWAIIVVPYPGVSAEDIEKTVTVNVEDELDGLDQVKQIASVTREGLAIVRVEFDEGVSENAFARLYQEVQTRFNKVALPEGALDPVIDDFSSSDFLPVVEVILSGEADFTVLNRTAKLLRERLRVLPEVSQVDMVGVRDRQIRIDADQDKVEALGIALNEIVRAVQLRNVTVPGGTLETSSREYLLRTLGEMKDVRDFGDVIVRKSQEGGKGVVRLRDVADMYEGLDPRGISERFNQNRH